jgi:beta-glucosidase
MNHKFLTIAAIVILLFSGSVLGQNTSLLPYQDTHLSIDERVNDLVSRMTIQEKVTQLFNQSEPIERLVFLPITGGMNACTVLPGQGKQLFFPRQ